VRIPLVCAARLDLALEHLPKAVMAPSADSDDKLSFRAKISQATRVGLIEPLIEQALHAVHGGRNDFAHSAPGPTLAEPRRQMAFPPQARVRFSNS
jgi:hypothetical protein